MEDILLIMNTKNKRLPTYILEKEVYKLIDDYSDPVRKDERQEIEDNSIQIILPIARILNDEYRINSDGVLEYTERFCSHCFSIKVNKKGYTWSTIYLEKGRSLKVKVKRYWCRHCGKWTQTEFSGYFEKYTGLPVEIKKLIKKHRGMSWMSLRNLKIEIENLTGIKLSHETIRKILLVEGDYYYLNKELKPSGYYAYDEQWEKVNGKWIYYYVLYDITYRVPVATFLTDSITNDKIKDFINKSIPPKDRIAIITDLKPGYETVMAELGFVHQYCVFHLSQRIWDKIFNYINEKLTNYRSELKNSNVKYSNSEIKKLAEQYENKLKNEMKKYLEIFMKLFNQETFDKAMDYITFLKSELHKFPKFLAEYLNKNFFPIYRKFIHFLEKDHIGKLDAYNNKIENFFGNTMPRYEKKFYRTWRGLWSVLMLKKEFWIEKRKKEHST